MKPELTPFMLGLLAGAILALVFVQVRSMIAIALPLKRIRMSGGQCSIFQLLFMQARRSPVQLLVDVYIALIQSDQPAELSELEQLYMQHRWTIDSADDLVRLYRENCDDDGETN